MIVLVAYGLAGTAALVVLQKLDGRGYHPLVEVLIADIIATVVVFGFSMFSNNSSIYDPYWSVAPIVIAMWFATDPGAAAPEMRQYLVIGLTFLWGSRLTYNWARHWDSLDKEDWRYVDIRGKTKSLYWPSSFLGIHMFPTLITFLGCVPMWYAVSASERGLGIVDGLAIVVTAAGIIIETMADRQLYDFVESKPEQGTILDTGLWAWSRHPNYFGEILFWWGIALFGIAAAPNELWQLAGAAGITLMFLTVSLPMIEKRMQRRRTNWDDHKKKVSLLVPLPPRKSA